MKSIDVATLKTLMAFMKPDKVAPVLPLVPSDFTKGSESAFGMAKDIVYLRETVNEIKVKLEKLTETHVTNTEFNEHVKLNAKAHDSYEKQLSIQNDRQTRQLTWGSVVIFLVALLPTILRLSGH